MGDHKLVVDRGAVLVVTGGRSEHRRHRDGYVAWLLEVPSISSPKKWLPIEIRTHLRTTVTILLSVTFPLEGRIFWTLSASAAGTILTRHGIKMLCTDRIICHLNYCSEGLDWSATFQRYGSLP